ncbi:hypothetical protein Cp1R7AA1_009 [Mesorhizobium phage Cp1R7A-A1]|nr:hypothetical protein Cp1R7AA1_009 [Mesorhizobium phage Cp1R7A-A1]
MFGWFRRRRNAAALRRASVQAARHLVDTKGNPLSLTDANALIATARPAHDRASRGLSPQPDFSGAFAPRNYPEPSAAPVRTVAYPQSAADPDIFSSVIVPLLVLDALTPDSPAPSTPDPVESRYDPPVQSHEPVQSTYAHEPAPYEPPAPHSVDSWTPASDPTPSYDSGPSYAPSYDSPSPSFD